MKKYFDYKESLENFLDEFDPNIKKEMRSNYDYIKITYIDKPWYCFKEASMNYFCTYNTNTSRAWEDTIFYTKNTKRNYEYWLSKDKKHLLIRHSYVNGVDVRELYLFNMDNMVTIDNNILDKILKSYKNIHLINFE